MKTHLESMHKYRLDENRVLEFSEDARVELTKAVIEGLSVRELHALFSRWMMYRPDDVRVVIDPEKPPAPVLLN